MSKDALVNKVFIALFVIFIVGCDNKDKSKDTIQSKKDTLACKDMKIDTELPNHCQVNLQMK